MNVRHNFVILFQGRAGSSFLIDALARLPDVIAEGEMLVGVDPAMAPFRNRLRRLFRPIREDSLARLQLTWVRDFYRRPWPGARAVGFKTKVRDVHDPPGLGRILEEERVRAVILERRNLVKQVVSNLNAERLHSEYGRWNLADGQAAPGRMDVDPERFDRELRRVLYEQEVLDAFVRFLRVPTIRLKYGDLVRDRRAWFDSVCDFLEVPRAKPESGLQKATPDDLRRVIANFDELRARYEGTRWAMMFDATDAPASAES